MAINIEQIEKLPYERRELIIEDMNINEWLALDDAGLMETESFQEYHALLTEVAEREIQESIEEHENAEPMEAEATYGGKLQYPYESKQRKKKYMDRNIAQYTEKQILEDALRDIRRKLESLQSNLDDGHYYYPTIEDKAERGFAIMDALGWKKITVEYSGGGDSGGIDGIKIITNDGEELSEDDWEPKGNAPLIPVLGRTNGWREKTIILDEWTTRRSLLVPNEPRGQFGKTYYHRVSDMLSVYAESLFWEDVNNYFGGWTCNYVGGSLTWDNDKNSKSYRRHPALDFEIQAPKSETVAISASLHID